MDTRDVREPAVDGRFYPDSPERLAQEVRKHLEAGRTGAGNGRVRALIAPHAGYTFSGAVAGMAYARIRDPERIRRVVVLAPAHQVAFSGVSVGDFMSFATPLGQVTVDREISDRLTATTHLISERRDAHRGEHSLEVQLPFLQTVLGPFKLVPIVCGQLRKEDMQTVAHTLADCLWSPDTLWVVSSDFTHFGRSFGYVPFRNEVPRRIEELDRGAIEQVLALDTDGFTEYVDRTGATICGRDPIRILTEVLRSCAPDISGELVRYTTSGALTGDYEHTVSYAGLVFVDHETAAAGPAPGAEPNRLSLTPEARRFLLRLAREVISSRVRGGPEPSLPASLPSSLQTEAAAFVTLHKRGELRGCIGHLQAREPLVMSVMHNAANAAFQDPRFPPVTESEVDDLEVEISVLTPSRTIDSVDEIELGRHGIILERGMHRSVFLPQVAVEQGWNLETTLRHLALKAGLEANDWRKASFSIFETILFSEQEPG